MVSQLVIPQITIARVINTTLLVSSNVFHSLSQVRIPETLYLPVKVLILIGVGRTVNVPCPDLLKGELRK